MRNEEIVVFYSNHYKRSGVVPVDDTEPHWVFLDFFLSSYSRMLNRSKGELSVLDAGCGTGRYAIKLLEEGFNDITAVELFDSVWLPDEIRYVKADIQELPFADESFDIIYSNSVLYYLNSPSKGINELSRCLKKGGMLFFSSHTKYSVFTLKRLFFRKICPGRVKHLLDVRFNIDVSEWIQLCRDAGLEIVWIDGIMLSPIIVPLYRKIVHRINRFLPRQKRFALWRVSKNKLIGRFKATFAYHSVVVAKKRGNVS